MICVFRHVQVCNSLHLHRSKYVVFVFRYDADNNQVIDQFELQILMEKLGAPQTHVALRQMIAEVDEDGDKAISFREVFLSKQETLMSNSVLCQTELC